MTDGSSYFVNADHPTSWATVHRADCLYVKNRKAKTRASDWSEHKTREAAFQHGKRTGCRTVKACDHCKRNYPFDKGGG